MDTSRKIVVQDKVYDEERALYNLKGATVKNCTFAGPSDGESVLKECRNVAVKSCSFSLRYPLWHAENFSVEDCKMDALTRAGLWYCKDGIISSSELGGIKAVRECDRILIDNCKINSPEFGWRCRTLAIADSEIVSEYFMFESRNLTLKNVKFTGKYSFQYVKNAVIENCDFSTKDAFWHSENITVKNSTLRGEYLGWYSKGLTLINCHITGTQPLCYCKKLKLINCTTEGCDLSFEYSEVDATISGGILSVKNPKKGKIVADAVGEVVHSDYNVPCKGKVIIR